MKKLFFTQPTRFSTAPLCWPARPAQLRREPVVERDLAEDRIPDNQLALPLQDDGLGIVPDVTSGTPPTSLCSRSQPVIISAQAADMDGRPTPRARIKTVVSLSPTGTSPWIPRTLRTETPVFVATAAWAIPTVRKM